MGREREREREGEGEGERNTHTYFHTLSGKQQSMGSPTCIYHLPTQNTLHNVLHTQMFILPLNVYSIYTCTVHVPGSWCSLW